MLTITHKYLSSHETRKHRHIFARVAAFRQRVFQTLPNLDVHPGVAVYHTLKIFSIVNAKDLLVPHTKFQVCTLKINTIFCHRKKIPLLLNNNNAQVMHVWCVSCCAYICCSPLDYGNLFGKFQYVIWFPKWKIGCNTPILSNWLCAFRLRKKNSVVIPFF